MRKFILVFYMLGTSAPALAQTTFHASDEAALRSAITSAAPGDTIVLDSNITLTSDLPSVATSLTLDGGGHTLSGNNQFRGLLVAAYSAAAGPTPIDVSIQNLTIANTVARGGDGGSGAQGGGGGAGLGGGLFVGQSANVTLSNVNVLTSAAVGGSGGAGGVAGVDNGGGGGMGGNGGNGLAGVSGGGGGAGSGASGGSNSAGGTGLLTGASPAGPGGGGQPGGTQGGGGGADSAGAGGGGAGGAGSGSGTGGAGGYGGGGGGATFGSAGGGGFGGGGGGGLNGNGGYGGGGGGTFNTFPSSGGFFGGSGGNSPTAGGGGGAGLGGALFVQSGGTITIAGTVTVDGNVVGAGAGASGGTDGSAFGAGLFLSGGGTLTFSTAAGETQTIKNDIADEKGVTGLDVSTWNIVKQGAGTLVLNGNNQYAGGTTIEDGTVTVASAAGLGAGDVLMHNASTLAVTGTTTFTQNLTIAGTPTLSVSAGVNATLDGLIADDRVVGSGSLTIAGGGTATVGNAANSYSGGTAVVGNSTLAIAADGVLGDAKGGVTLGDASSGGTLSFLSGTTMASNRLFTLGAGGGTFDTAGTADVDITGSITGTGGFTKTGTGTLTLSGTNSYGGSTVVGGGVLRGGAVNVFNSNGAMQVNAGATLDLNGNDQSVGSLAGAGSITLGSATLTAGSDNTSSLFSGVVSGAGPLVKAGTGALTLTGANNYTGGTTVSAGSLVGTTTSLQGTIQNDANVTFDQSTNGTYASAMSGTGTLTKTGAGTVTLTGANSYTGGTIVDTGVLAGSTTSLQGNITNNAAVQFDQTSNGTYAGVMSGTGSLVKSGGGTLTLTGANTYKGGTLIAGGTLVGDTTSIQGSVVDNAQLVLNQTTNGTFSGSITGSGSLTKNGAGTLTLAGSSTYTGGTIVNAGTLAGTSQSLQGSIQDNASVVFQQDFAGASNAAISGAGSVTKSGTGALFLTGANTYTGGTVVSGGSLIGTTSSLQGAIQNDARVIFSQGGSGTYAGAMTGTGSLAMNGAGTLTLTGNNTYSGGTSIAGGGAISVGQDAVLGASAGGVTLGDTTSNGTLTFTNSGLFSSNRSFVLGAAGGVFNTIGTSPVTIGGGVSGIGGLTKTGGGVLVLGGANTYTGATSIVAGTLRANGANAFGTASPLFLAAGTTVDLNGFAQTVGSIGGSGNIALGSGTLTTGGDGSSSAFGGVISGAGSLVKTGGGTLVLTGANTYSGGTQVLGGTLAGDTGTLQGDILNNSLVQFDQHSNGTYAGSMSGSGALAKTGDGTLTLTGANTYTGGTIINGGSVVSSGSSLQGLIINNAQLTLGGAADGTFSGTLAGTGGTTKTGTGTLTLNGAQTTSGLFSVSQGTLVLNGSIAGSVDVASGASLRANGVVGGNLTLAGSLFVVPPPGTSASQPTAQSAGRDLDGAPFLTVGRDFTATPGSLLDFTVGPGATPTILVGGTANLNGAQLNITAPSIGTSRSASFLALAAANGLTLSSSNVTTGDTAVVPLLKQDRNGLFVTLLNLHVPLQSVSGPGTAAPAAAIDRGKLRATGDGAFVARELTALDDRSLGDALEQIGGQLHASVLQTAVQDTETVSDLVRDQLQARQAEDVAEVRWWGETACQRANYDRTSQARGGHSDICTGAGGADRRISDRWTVGGGGSFTGGNMNLDGMGNGDYSAPRAFGYLGFKPKAVGVRAGGSTSHSSYSTQRHIQFQALLPAVLGGEALSEGVDRVAEAKQNGTTADAWSELHDSRKIKTYTLEGLFGLRRARVSRGNFSEDGAIALDLNVAEQILNLTQTDLKVHLWRREGTYRPFADFNFRHELTTGQMSADLSFDGFPDSNFTIEGIGVPNNSYSGRGGVTMVTLIGQATLAYEFKVAPGQKRQTLGFRVRFK